MKYTAAALAILLLLAPIASAQWIPVPNPPDSFQGIELFYPGEDRIYAGTFNGRVFGSTDHGDTWIQLADGLPENQYSIVTAMAIVGDWFIMSRFGLAAEDPHNFRSQRVGGAWSTWEILEQDQYFTHFAPIGETLFASSVEVNAIHRTDDFGASWTPVAAPSENPGFRIFAHEGRLFAAEQIVNGGTVYRSDDLGTTWTDIGSELGSSYLFSENYWQGRLLVSVHYGDGYGSFFSSQDFGDSWEEISTLPISYVVTCMAIAQDGRLAIGTWNGNPQGGTIWLSDDLVGWENHTANLTFPTWITYSLVAHDGWFYKGGGANTEFRSPQPRPTAVDDDAASVPRLALTAHPNPFNPNTTFGFVLDQASRVDLSVYDLSGRRVTTIISGPMSAGAHDLHWDARDDSGRLLASGVYLARLVAGSASQSLRVILLK